ncbi:hypothetical protein BKA63DRAFT_566683 [Paraphoma chrysanthemicola]|nr:hypothetical protein BKA63DRAFT_566683 [Paraphoma chrysanthemicola]
MVNFPETLPVPTGALVGGACISFVVGGVSVYWYIVRGRATAGRDTQGQARAILPASPAASEATPAIVLSPAPAPEAAPSSPTSQSPLSPTTTHLQIAQAASPPPSPGLPSPNLPTPTIPNPGPHLDRPSYPPAIKTSSTTPTTSSADSSASTIILVTPPETTPDEQTGSGTGPVYLGERTPNAHQAPDVGKLAKYEKEGREMGVDGEKRIREADAERERVKEQGERSGFDEELKSDADTETVGERSGGEEEEDEEHVDEGLEMVCRGLTGKKGN